MKQTIILLYGGRSAEREVSVLSAESVMRAVNYDRFTVKTFFISQSGDFIKTQEFSQTPGQEDRLMTNATIDWDKKIAPSAIYEEGAVVFPVLHGPMGEDGSVQGFLEVLKMPYVGCNILSSSLAMDKITTKRVLESAGIAQVPYVAIVEGDDVASKIAEVEEKLTYPVFTKPSNMGSSVGISKSENQEELRKALELAFQYDSRVLVEQGVNARVTMDIPAKISDDVVAVMRHNAETAFRAIGGLGLSRCDFFYTDKGEVFLNELNTMPGFTQWSMYPLLWDNMGISYPDLIEHLVGLAKESFNKHEAHLL